MYTQRVRLFQILVVLVAVFGNVYAEYEESGSGVIEEQSCDFSLATCKAKMEEAVRTVSYLQRLNYDAEVRVAKLEKKWFEHISGTKVAFNNVTGLYNSTTCEGKKAEVSCPLNHVIHIEYANYGRFNDKDCHNIHMSDTNCKTEKTWDIVVDRCNGTQSCHIAATNDVFGDPCYGTYKYLQINYNCVFNEINQL